MIYGDVIAQENPNETVKWQDFNRTLPQCAANGRVLSVTSPTGA